MDRSFEDLVGSFSQLQLERTQCRINMKLIKKVMQEPEQPGFGSALWPVWLLTTENKWYKLVPVETFSADFNRVACKFQASAPRLSSITKIERVENPLLFAQYLLKKEQMTEAQGGYVNEMELFHGTRRINIDSICKNNFDWRLNGTARGNKFGRGVSFSPSAFYASHYNHGDKVMFLVKVVMGRSCLGNCFTTIPPSGYNSTQNGKGSVYVTYEDAQFYPQYVIYYT